MSIGIPRALKTIKDQTVDYIGISIASLKSVKISDTPDESRKTKFQLFRLTAIVCGIELCYAAETAFVSPILLKLGVPTNLMTLAWSLSPFLGFFLVPLLGSCSDRCRSSLGRRRPFILALSIGIIIGLILVPNGEIFGCWLGDTSEESERAIKNFLENITRVEGNGTSVSMPVTGSIDHSRGIMLTIFGVALLDFTCDACQSPSRAYLLDVSVSDDHSRGLTSFTVLAGFGGSIGYMFGGIDWNSTSFGEALGGHIRVVFTLVLFVFIVCVVLTVTSFEEVSLDELMPIELSQHKKKKVKHLKYKRFTNEEDDDDDGGGEEANFEKGKMYGTIQDTDSGVFDTNSNMKDDPTDKTEHISLEYLSEDETRGQKQTGNDIAPEVDSVTISTDVTLKTYLLSIIRMPKSIFILCLTNLLSWMSLLCYSLYFTDFVGQCVYGGEPTASRDSNKHKLYDDGLRLGSFGMSLYSLSCAIYSLCIDRLVKRFGAKKIYVVGPIMYTLGMAVIAATRHKIAVLIFSPCAGLQYATLFTMPYIIVANYHTKGVFEERREGQKLTKQVRGLGTDVALVSSMVFVGQLILSFCMGGIVAASGSTVAVVITAAVLSFSSAIISTQVLYLDL